MIKMVQLNDRWYRWLKDDTLEEVRVIRIQNEDVCTVAYTKGPNTGVWKTTKSTIEECYIKLRPNGFLTFSVVDVSNGNTDIMATISTYNDIKAGIKEPYAVCRQCALDLFAKQLNPDNMDYVGISVSRDTCPADVDFSNFFACNGILYSETMSYYIGDTLESCLDIIKKPRRFSDVLEENFNKHCMYLANGNKFIAQTYKDKEEVDGYCKSLPKLLELNNFGYDVYSAFGIISTDLTSDDFSEQTLSGLAMEVLGSLLRVEIGKSLVVPYDRDIDFNKIKRRYCLVSDVDNNIYVVAYTVVGKYIVPVENTESDENIDKMAKVLSSESLQLAYQHIKFNSNKYK